MTSRIRRWRGVKPCSSAGPSGRELTDAVSPNWAATSAALGRPRFRFGAVEWRVKSSWSLMNHTLEKGDQRIKHLFEVCRVGENCRCRVVNSFHEHKLSNFCSNALGARSILRYKSCRRSIERPFDEEEHTNEHQAGNRSDRTARDPQGSCLDCHSATGSSRLVLAVWPRSSASESAHPWR